MEHTGISFEISFKSFPYHLPKPWTNYFSSEMVDDPVLVARKYDPLFWGIIEGWTLSKRTKPQGIMGNGELNLWWIISFFFEASDRLLKLNWVWPLWTGDPPLSWTGAGDRHFELVIRNC